MVVSNSKRLGNWRSSWQARFRFSSSNLDKVEMLIYSFNEVNIISLQLQINFIELLEDI